VRDRKGPPRLLASDGPKVELALIRRPASDKEHRIGSLFVNPGGPGGSGVDFIRTAPPFALAAFGRLYDMVGFDPRGVGASRPAIRGCQPRLGDRFMTPETLDTRLLLRNAREQLPECQARSGGILPYLTTGNVARDLDRLRAAVGDKEAQLHWPLL
jgi:pimeloyl-ACP methyl ester carboxylesterase